MSVVHICQPAYAGLAGGMRELYDALGLLPTSTNADVVLIRSHIAYWSGSQVAERVSIRPSRGRSYRVSEERRRHLVGRLEKDVIVGISDHFDHREGVTGWK